MYIIALVVQSITTVCVVNVCALKSIWGSCPQLHTNGKLWSCPKYYKIATKFTFARAV